MRSMVPRIRAVSSARAVVTPETVIARAARATPASAPTIVLHLAFISSSLDWRESQRNNGNHKRPLGGVPLFLRCLVPELGRAVRLTKPTDREFSQRLPLVRIA